MAEAEVSPRVAAGKVSPRKVEAEAVAEWAEVEPATAEVAVDWSQAAVFGAQVRKEMMMQTAAEEALPHVGVAACRGSAVAWVETQARTAMVAGAAARMEKQEVAAAQGARWEAQREAKKEEPPPEGTEAGRDPAAP